MIRIIVEISDASMAANVGGPVHMSHVTVDIDAPTVERALRAANAYQERRVIGVEVLPAPAQTGVATTE